ncbi:universal stress protein [uncultured Lutibacter sp.]|uniref:universal stress protein n=1 Tax=uncultured Lutibacter sp. TaxID=437739 RepID=UPI002638E7B7|nr:universal stress protein [uncultured Lutibacter sp.]
MKNVLILTDFSDKSWNSIEYALGLFQNTQCTFHLLHAGKRNENEVENEIYDQFQMVKVFNKRDTKRAFDVLLQKLKTLSLKGNHKFVSVLDNNNIVEAARNQIKNNKIDLIVIGADDMTLKGKINKNSISEDVITKVKCSVLVVPEEARFTGLFQIGVPTDFTNFYEAKLLQDLTNRGSYSNSALRFLYLSKENDKLNKEQSWNKETLHDYYINKEHSFHSEVNPNLEISMQKFIEEKKIDIVVLAAKNLNLFEQILFRPKTERLDYYSKTPFLALHQSNF